MTATGTPFYRHYWACETCSPWRMCAEGKELSEEYRAEVVAERISKIGTLYGRRNAIAALKPELAEKVKQKLQEIWDGGSGGPGK